jgi:alpha-2-macroglobulin
MEIKRGELVRVDLFVSIPAARNFVVVNDPIPGGLEPVNNDLATSSIVDAIKGEYKPAGGSWWFKYNDWTYYGVSRWSFYHRELRHHAASPAGNYHLSYPAEAIASGEFTVMPTHAEEM